MVGFDDGEGSVDAVEERKFAEEASLAGWTLVQRETDLGQLVWSWTRADCEEPGPQFLTRREAMDFMRELELLPPVLLDELAERTPEP